MIEPLDGIAAPEAHRYIDKELPKSQKRNPGADILMRFYLTNPGNHQLISPYS